MNRSQWKWLGISVSFSVVVLLAVLYFTVNESTFAYLRRLNPLYLGLAIILHFAAFGFWAMRIRKMAASLGYPLGFSYCFNLVLANLLAASVTPAQAGGEPVRIHQLYRANVPVGDATAIVIVERVMDCIVLSMLGIIAIVLLQSSLQNLTGGFEVFIYIGMVMMVGFVLLFVYTVRKPESLKHYLKKGSGWFVKKWELHRVQKFIGSIDCEVDNFHRSAYRFVNHARNGLLWGGFYTLLFWLSEFLIVSLILLGLGEKPFFVASLIAQILIAILMMIPLTPGSSGIAELSALSIYSLFVNPAIVGVMVVLWRVIFYYLNIIVGILASIPILQRELVIRSKDDPKV